MLSGESYYPSHASLPVEEIRITLPVRSSGCAECDAIFDASDYERPSLPPVMRERLARAL